MKNMGKRVILFFEPTVKAFGFEFDRDLSPSGASLWSFTRQTPFGRKEIIQVQKSLMHKNGLRIMLTIEGLPIFLDVGTRYIAEREFDPWWTYSDANSLRRVLSELGDLATKYAPDWFEAQRKNLTNHNLE